jgi:Flp pilus assembly pilin Flp
MIVKRILNFVVDDRGQDLVEYAVTTGMVTVTSLVAAVLLGLYLGAAYSRTETGMQALWEPCAPGGCP